MMRMQKLMKNAVLLAVMLSMTILCGCGGQKSSQNQAHEKSSAENSGALAQEKSSAERVESLESIFKSYASREDLDDFERDVLNRAVKQVILILPTMKLPTTNIWSAWLMQDMMSTTPKCPMDFIRVQRTWTQTLIVSNGLSSPLHVLTIRLK